MRRRLGGRPGEIVAGRRRASAFRGGAGFGETRSGELGGGVNGRCRENGRWFEDEEPRMP